jgi:class 3 adenylate cyclase
MVSPAVIDQLDPDKLQLGGKRTEITTLFADIREFTSFSESQPPEVLVAVLNRYLAAAAEAVLAHQGTIDKFLDDAVMVGFNAPIQQEDHALRAVLAALDIRAAVERLQKELPAQFRLSFGAGIHFGEAYWV